jgi:hypothetical protein
MSWSIEVGRAESGWHHFFVDISPTDSKNRAKIIAFNQIFPFTWHVSGIRCYLLQDQNSNVFFKVKPLAC